MIYGNLSQMNLKLLLFFYLTQSPNDFFQSVMDSSDALRDILVSEWIPNCAEIIKSGLQRERESLKSRMRY